MRILLFGASGQLGKDLIKLLQNTELKELNSKQCNFKSKASIKNAIKKYNPSLVINAAAYTGVDSAESNW